MDEQQRAANEAAQVKTLILWAQVAMRFFATRVFSILALAGGVALGFYVVWTQNDAHQWQGVAVFIVYAAMFRECVKSEDRARDAQRSS